MHQAEPEDPNYQLKEVFIVLVTDTVIQIATMMIKPRYASIAFTAVLRPTQHMGITDLAVVVIIRRIKSYIVSLAIYFQLDCLVRGIFHGREVSIIGCADTEYGIARAQSD